MAEPMPERRPGESILDYTARVQEWQQSGGAAGTAVARPTTATRDFDRENYEEKVAKGWPDYAFGRDLTAKGYVELPNGKFVNRTTGDSYIRLNTPLQDVDPIYQHGFPASQADVRAALAIQQQTAPEGLPGALRGQAPGGFWTTRAGFERDTQAAGGRIPGELVNLGRGLDLLRNYERPIGTNAITSLNVYDPYTRGGPGRAGYTPLISGWNEKLGGGSPFTPFNRRMFSDSYLITPEGYGGASGRDFFSQGEPSVATTFGGGNPATLSTGTAGAEIRGGAAGGWGGDAGAILASHGIEPSGDPLVDAGRAAEIAEGFGAFSFQEGGEVWAGPTTNDPVGEGWPSGDPVVNFPPNPTVPTPGTAAPPVVPVVPPAGLEPPVATATLPTPVGPPALPNPPPPVSAYDAAAQRADYGQNLYGYRRSLAGLPQMQAIDLAPGEVPPGPAPAGYYYRPYDAAAAQREALTNWSLAPGRVDLSNYMQGLSAPFDLAQQAYMNQQNAVNQAPFNLAFGNYMDQQRDLTGAQWNIDFGNYMKGLYEQTAQANDPLNAPLTPWEQQAYNLWTQGMGPLPWGLDTHGNRRRIPSDQPETPQGGQWSGQWWPPGGGFAQGGELGYGRPMINEGPDGVGGRKSMIVPEPSLIVGQRTGTPYGQMSEAGAELLSDQGNRLRIDPMRQQGTAPPPRQGTLPNVTPQEFTYLLKTAPDVATSLAQLDLSLMRTGNAPAAQMEMALGKAEGISDPNVRQRALNTYRNIVGRINSMRMQPPDLSLPAMPEDPVALAAAIKFSELAKTAA